MPRGKQRMVALPDRGEIRRQAVDAQSPRARAGPGRPAGSAGPSVSEATCRITRGRCFRRLVACRCGSAVQVGQRQCQREAQHRRSVDDGAPVWNAIHSARRRRPGPATAAFRDPPGSAARAAAASHSGGGGADAADRHARARTRHRVQHRAEAWLRIGDRIGEAGGEVDACRSCPHRLHGEELHARRRCLAGPFGPPRRLLPLQRRDDPASSIAGRPGPASAHRPAPPVPPGARRGRRHRHGRPSPCSVRTVQRVTVISPRLNAAPPPPAAAAHHHQAAFRSAQHGMARHGRRMSASSASQLDRPARAPGRPSSGGGAGRGMRRGMRGRSWPIRR